MRNNIFCVHCGQKNTFEFSKPKFCNHCGQPFGAIATAVAPVSVSKPVSTPRKFQREIEEEVVTEFPAEMEVDIAAIGSIFRPLKEALAEPPSGLPGRAKPKGKVSPQKWWKDMSARLKSSDEINIGGEE